MVTANNRVVSGPAGNAFGLTWGEPYRAKRIRDLIEAKRKLGVADVLAFQLDRFSGGRRISCRCCSTPCLSTRRRGMRWRGCADGIA